MPIHKTIRMVEREDGSYRTGSASAIGRRLDAGTLRLAGVDGDEEANTVTYWYDRIEGN